MRAIQAVAVVVLGTFGCESDNYEYDEFPVTLRNDWNQGIAFRWKSADVSGGPFEVLGGESVDIIARAPDELIYAGGGGELPSFPVEFQVSVENQGAASIDCLYAESLGGFRQVTWSGAELECVNWPEWIE